MDFTYLGQSPARYTFEMPQLKLWVEKWCIGRVLNLFGGKIRLNVDEVSNDIDPEMPTTHHQDAMEFVKGWAGEKFDTLVLDPPYNMRKAREKYGARYIGSFTKIQNELLRILKDNARVISLGYNSGGMSNKRGFRKIAICLIYHGGDHQDTIAVVEERHSRILDNIEDED